jgi:uncharacterized membrane protein YhaH (DUF805 family)
VLRGEYRALLVRCAGFAGCAPRENGTTIVWDLRITAAIGKECPLMLKWFNARGRISRRQYLLSCIAIYLVTFGWFYVGGLMTFNEDVAIKTTGMLLFVTTLVAGGVVNGFLIIRRLHDLGKPGTHGWLLFVPMYSIYLHLVLLFARGVEGQNQYGPDPVAA